MHRGTIASVTICFALALTGLAIAGPAADGEAGPKPAKLYAVNVENAQAVNLGGFFNAAVDPANRRLYADNGRGVVVRWSLDNLSAQREIFARAPGSANPDFVPGYGMPHPAPQGGLVAVFQGYPQRGQPRRVTASWLDATGQVIAGPLPITRTDGVFQPDRAFAWQPLGERVALEVTEGQHEEGYGLYVFEPKTDYWVKAREAQPGGEQLAWQPGEGLLLSVLFLNGGRLAQRGGADYGKLRDVDLSRYNPQSHAWLDMESILVVGSQGLAVADFESGDLKQAVQGAQIDQASRLAVGPHGVAWCEVEGDRINVWHWPGGQENARRIFSMVAPVGNRVPPKPAWHPADPVLYVAPVADLPAPARG